MLILKRTETDQLGAIVTVICGQALMLLGNYGELEIIET